ncbi:MAG: hypothetical protein NTW17_00395 [Candidatus Pacearchaeota archaeon]|nr:hypothetical protein [Candidatus Pacearchaeota archaeon]
MQKPNITYYVGDLSPFFYASLYKQLKDASGTEPFTGDDGISYFMLTGGLIVRLDWNLDKTEVEVRRWNRTVPEKISEILATAKLKRIENHKRTSLDDQVTRKGLTEAPPTN